MYIVRCFGLLQPVLEAITMQLHGSLESTAVEVSLKEKLNLHPGHYRISSLEDPRDVESKR